MPQMPVSLSDCQAVLFPDGTWHNTPAGIGVVLSPSFLDPTTGTLVTPGDNWIQLVDDTGQAYAAPMRSVMAVKLGAPVA